MSGELYDTENNPVVVILELDVKGKGGIKFDEIKVVSAYGKESMQNLIDSSRVQYISKDCLLYTSYVWNDLLEMPRHLGHLYYNLTSDWTCNCNSVPEVKYED